MRAQRGKVICCACVCQYHIILCTRGMQSIVGRAELGLGDKRLRGRGKRGGKGENEKKGGKSRIVPNSILIVKCWTA